MQRCPEVWGPQGGITEVGKMSDELVRVQPFIGGSFLAGEAAGAVIPDKYDGSPRTRVDGVSPQQVADAITSLDRAFQTTTWDIPARYRVFAAAARLLLNRREEFVQAVMADSGFTVMDAEREVGRTAETLLACGEEAKRLVGEVVPISSAPGQLGRIGFTAFYPMGIVCAITPFNSPLNTVVHKIGPALAAGNVVILKPASQTPRSADLLVKLLLECGLPETSIAVVYGSGARLGKLLAEDKRVQYYAFTGSTQVGMQLHQAIGLRRSQLELGSLSSTLICSDANLDRCVNESAMAAFRKAGQVCTSVQRLYVQRPVLSDVSQRLKELAQELVAGDPTAPGTFVGPVISSAEADRIQRWTHAALDRGADLVVGGQRDRQVIAPTILSNVAADTEVMIEEIFGPVMVLRPFDDLSEAIDEVNDTPFGLAAGIYTRDIGVAMTAANRLRMGSVHINQTSSSRVDVMPYSGVKDSGFGREGPRYAMRDMSEERLITVTSP
jgi:acyl-CoA reductase-like NAD-dependent aldehyde dehydrogenase